MAEYVKMDVTPNVTYCLGILKEAVQELSDETSKKNAGYALKYLEDRAAGFPLEPGDSGEDCSPPIKIMPLEGA